MAAKLIGVTISTVTPYGLRLLQDAMKEGDDSPAS